MDFLLKELKWKYTVITKCRCLCSLQLTGETALLPTGDGRLLRSPFAVKVLLFASPSKVADSGSSEWLLTSAIQFYFLFYLLL